jgi:PPOX class probable F420-dependent enzyme
MAQISDAPVRELLDKPNHAVVSTLNDDGTIHSTVVWASAEGEHVLLNSALGRKWPKNLDRDPRVTVTVYDQANPYEYVEIRGRAESTLDGADEHIDHLAKVYLGADTYPFRQPGEQRVKITVTPERVRHQKQ